MLQLLMAAAVAGIIPLLSALLTWQRPLLYKTIERKDV